jgi:antitoxin component YwqK of YwqJK toxin-antitoxin module
MIVINLEDILKGQELNNQESVEIRLDDLIINISKEEKKKEDIFTSEVDDEGNQHWFKNGKLHRDNDLPAIIWASGNLEWYKNGKLHRDNDLPAKIQYGSLFWYKEGKKHRDNDLPAMVWSITGDKEWWVNGAHIKTNI